MYEVNAGVFWVFDLRDASDANFGVGHRSLIRWGIGTPACGTYRSLKKIPRGSKLRDLRPRRCNTAWIQSSGQDAADLMSSAGYIRGFHEDLWLHVSPLSNH